MSRKKEAAKSARLTLCPLYLHPIPPPPRFLDDEVNAKMFSRSLIT